MKNMETNKKKKDSTDTQQNSERDITKETLKPITKVHSELDKELQELEVESTKGGMNAE
jgi:hypothetical protein